METKEILSLLQPIAETFNVAVKELWGIFVKRYLVKGISEIVTTLVLEGVAYYIFTHANPLYALIPGAIGLFYVYDAIQLIFNPQYFALQEIIEIAKNKGDKNGR